MRSRGSSGAGYDPERGAPGNGMIHFPMQYLFFVLALVVAAYGAVAGQGWALVVGALLAVVAASRSVVNRGARDTQQVRKLLNLLFGSWWKIAFCSRPLVQWPLRGWSSATRWMC